MGDLRDRILAAPDQGVPPANDRDDVIRGLLIGAQAQLATAMRLLGQRPATAPIGDVEPEKCEHPENMIETVGGFGDEPGQRFCRACGTEIE